MDTVEQTLGDGDGGQGSLACCSPWGRKESDTTERLNNKGPTATGYHVTPSPLTALKGVGQLPQPHLP